MIDNNDMMSITNLILLLIASIVVVGLAVLVRAAGRANEADWGRWLPNRIDGLTRMFVRRYHRFEPKRLDLPEQGPALVVANHISGLDPLLLVCCCRRPLHFLIAEEQYRRFGLTWLFDLAGCIPVEKTTRPDRALRVALRALEEGKVIALFPFGRMHLDSEPPIKIKGGVSVLAARTGAPVYPARIEGQLRKKTVVRAVIYRGRPKLFPLEPMRFGHEDAKQKLQQLAKLLSTPVDEAT